MAQSVAAALFPPPGRVSELRKTWKVQMEEAKHICVYSGSAHPELSQQIANYLGISLGKVHLTHFPDGEYFVQFEENVRRADAFLIQPTCKPPNDNLMELLIMIDAARRASAARITAVLPYFGYARQDRKDKPRVPITAKLVANLITEAGADRIITMDLHSQQIQGFFDIPMDHLYARPVLVPYLKKLVGSNGVVVAPDSGSAKMAMNYGDMLEAGFAVVTKRRINATTVASSHLVGDVKDKNCVITDDLTSTAGTLCAAAKILKANGAAKIYAGRFALHAERIRQGETARHAGDRAAGSPPMRFRSSTISADASRSCRSRRCSARRSGASTTGNRSHRSSISITRYYGS